MFFKLNKVFLLAILIFSMSFAQKLTTDWKVTDVGQIRQLLTNQGLLWPAGYSIPLSINTEFPPGSYEEHIGEAGNVVSVQQECRHPGQEAQCPQP